MTSHPSRISLGFECLEPRKVLVAVAGYCLHADTEILDRNGDSPGELVAVASNTEETRTSGFQRASRLPDLSGLTWLGEDLFLAVHDAKNPKEKGLPRVSLVKLPSDLDGILWKPLHVNWPGAKSSDLESAARIPGTQDILLVESGDGGDPFFHRIFRARFEGTRLKIQAVVDWPLSIFNVEASAVVKLGDRFVFLFAERAENQASTEIRWAWFDPRTLQFGPFDSITFNDPDPDHINRPVVAMDVDLQGRIYVASAFDAEAAELPNPDNGPFSSSIWAIGTIQLVQGSAQVSLFDTPQRQATLNGLKVESVAVRENDSGEQQLFVGVDDENYGGTMRLLPAANSLIRGPVADLAFGIMAVDNHASGMSSIGTLSNPKTPAAGRWSQPIPSIDLALIHLLNQKWNARDDLEYPISGVDSPTQPTVHLAQNQYHIEQLRNHTDLLGWRFSDELAAMG